METWKVNDHVFAYWEDEGYWYPAIITGINGEDIDVRFDGYEEEATLGADYLDELSVEIDEEVESWWENDESYYSARITDIKGEQIQVEYEDGSSEWTDISNLRVPAYEELEVGDHVFAYWEEDAYWYPATILGIDDAGIQVRFDGYKEEATVEADCLDELGVEVGEEVESWWKSDESYYPARVNDVNGDQVQVEYEDGSTEWTDISNLRIAAEEED